MALPANGATVGTPDNGQIRTLSRFAERMTDLMQREGYSFRELGAASGVNFGYLNKVANGSRRTPHHALVVALDKALKADGELIRLAQLEGAPAPKLSPRPLSETDAARVRATTEHLVALDTLDGSDGLVPVASRAFRTAADRLAVVGGTADVRSAVADLGAAAAWIASDAVERDRSRAIALEALALADIAGDTRLHRFLLSHLSMNSEHAGRFGDALAFADRIRAEHPDSPRVQAMVELRRARALSGLGGHSEAIDAWDRAEHMLTATPSAEDGLTYWINEGEMAVHRAVILARNDDRSALDWAFHGVAVVPDAQGRDQVLWRAMLLNFAVFAKAWHEVPLIVDDLMQYAGEVRSARVPEVLATAWRTVSRQRVPRAARDAVRAAYDAFHAVD